MSTRGVMKNPKMCFKPGIIIFACLAMLSLFVQPLYAGVFVDDGSTSSTTQADPQVFNGAISTNYQAVDNMPISCDLPTVPDTTVVNTNVLPIDNFQSNSAPVEIGNFDYASYYPDPATTSFTQNFTQGVGENYVDFSSPYIAAEANGPALLGQMPAPAPPAALVEPAQLPAMPQLDQLPPPPPGPDEWDRVDWTDPVQIRPFVGEERAILTASLYALENSDPNVRHDPILGLGGIGEPTADVLPISVERGDSGANGPTGEMGPTSAPEAQGSFYFSPFQLPTVERAVENFMQPSLNLMNNNDLLTQNISPNRTAQDTLPLFQNHEELLDLMGPEVRYLNPLVTSVSTAVELPNRRIDVYFTPSYINRGLLGARPGYAFIGSDTIIIDTNYLTNHHVGQIRDVIANGVEDLPGIDNFFRVVFNGMSDQQIFESYAREQLYHEVIHFQTRPFINRWLAGELDPRAIPISYDLSSEDANRRVLSARVLDETLACLGQLAISDQPRYLLHMLTFKSYGDVSMGGPEQPYYETGRVVTSEIFNALGYSEFVLNREIELARSNNGGTLTRDREQLIRRALPVRLGAGEFYGPNDYEYQREFISSLSNQQIQQAAGRAFERIYGHPLPSADLARIPQAAANMYNRDPFENINLPLSLSDPRNLLVPVTTNRLDNR